MVKGTVSPGNVITSPISIFIAFLNISCQDDVVCITIYLKLLIIDRETNRQISTVSNVGIVLQGHAEPGSDADDVPLFLCIFNYLCAIFIISLLSSFFAIIMS